MSKQAANYSPTIHINVCNRNFELHRITDLESLWDELCASPSDSAIDDERIPYWTELWPSSIALSNWIYKQKTSIHKKNCLDMGCGLGLTALVGSWLGAQVLAMDYEEDALHFAHKNAEVNNISQPTWTVMDWRKPALKRGSMDFLWAGDIMYERVFVQPVFNFIDYVLAKEGKAWVAEPNRSIYEFFRAEIIRRNWLARPVYEERVDASYAQDVPVNVTVWEITR